MIISILVFFLILSILVLIHEAGHFFMAKKMGVKVEEFGFGFPPRIIGKKFGETTYSLNLLPIGGFVKLYGEDEAGGGKLAFKIEDADKKKSSKEDLKRAFFAKSAWQRFLIVIAGVVMNFLLAVIIISYLFTVRGVPIPTNHIIIAAVAKNSPAEKSGMQVGDIIISIDQQAISDPSKLIAYTKLHLGKEMTLVLRTTKGEQRIVKVTPRVHYPKDEGAMGIAIAEDVQIKKYPWYQAPFVGLVETAKQSWDIVLGLGSAIVEVATQGKVPEGLAGPIGIAQVTGQFVQVGFDAVLSLMALLSLNLAVLNVLPIPALDGGRLFFILYEIVTRRKVHPKFEGYAHAVGMAILLLLIILITIHDLFRIFTKQPIVP